MTSIQGPYDLHPRDDRTMLQASVPTPVARATFHSRLTFKGAQDRILANLFDWFVSQLDHLEVPESFDITNEQHATYILNELKQFRVKRPDQTNSSRSTDHPPTPTDSTGHDG